MIFGLATIAFVFCIIFLIYLQKPAQISPRRLPRKEDDAGDKNEEN